MAGQTASEGAPRPQGMSDEQWARVQERRRMEEGQNRVVVNPNVNNGTNEVHGTMTQAQLENIVEQERK